MRDDANDAVDVTLALEEHLGGGIVLHVPVLAALVETGEGLETRAEVPPCGGGRGGVVGGSKGGGKARGAGVRDVGDAGSGTRARAGETRERRAEAVRHPARHAKRGATPGNDERGRGTGEDVPRM